MNRTPRELGLRWPAEWEPHRATWLAWPHNEETWPGLLAGAEAAFVEMVAALQPTEEVCICVRDAAHAEHVLGLLKPSGLDAGVTLLPIPTNDAWIRDHGPLLLLDSEGERVAVDFGFDSWGRKYPPWDLDERVPEQIADRLQVPRLTPGFVLEGGSVDGNGDGMVLTTASCLLNPNRLRPGEPIRTRVSMEARLSDWLGADQVVWLEDGIEGDDTDGHVDDIARFVGPHTVVAVRERDTSDPNHRVLEANWRVLSETRDGQGRALTPVALPMPPPVVQAGQRLPASYANFYLANEVALVPVFEAATDQRALAVLTELLPGRRVVPISASALVLGLGACHCLTQQEPARPAPR